MTPRICAQHELDPKTWLCRICGKKAPFALRKIAPAERGGTDGHESREAISGETYEGAWDFDLGHTIDTKLWVVT